MDAQFWIYVIIGVIYFLSRVLKKGEQTPEQVPDVQRPERRASRQTGQEQPAEETPRQLTFEELLREITEGKQVQKRQPKPEFVPKYQSYEKDPGAEARSLEEIDVNEARTSTKWKPYEEIPAQAPVRKSLEETLRLEDTIVDFRKFDAFEKKDQKKLSDEYMKMLRNPQTLKQAVVLSEILKRKF